MNPMANCWDISHLSTGSWHDSYADFPFFRLKNTTGYPPFLVKKIDPFLADLSGSNLQDTVFHFLVAQTVIQLAQCWWSAKDSKQPNAENHAVLSAFRSRWWFTRLMVGHKYYGQALRVARKVHMAFTHYPSTCSNTCARPVFWDFLDDEP
jgi:hypothetical protein